MTEPKHPRDPEAKMTACLCPLCRQEHELKLHWIGRGIPRKYCSECLDLLDGLKDHPSVNFFKRGHSLRPHVLPEKIDRNINNWKTG